MNGGTVSKEYRMDQGGITRKSYQQPSVNKVGSVADLTRNGFSNGNDVGEGASGIKSKGKGSGLPSF